MVPAGVIIGLVDSRGWLLLQERDEFAPIEPNLWGFVGGGIEAGETAEDAAHRELVEETGLTGVNLISLGVHDIACDIHGRDIFAVFTARTDLIDADLHCGEGRQVLFVEPRVIPTLDLTGAARALFQYVLDQTA